jgi:integrase
MPSPRPTLAKFGKHGRRVRVLRNAATSRIHVQWWEGVKCRVKVFPDSAAGCKRAKRFARETSRRRAIDAPVTAHPVRPRHRPTIDEVWEAYQEATFGEDSEHQLPGYCPLRDATVRNYCDHMRLWLRFVGRSTIADTLTHEDADRFRLRMAKHGYAVHSARRVIGTVRAVLRWAHGRQMIEHDRLETYKVRMAKDAQALEPGEYTTDQIDAILRQWDPCEPRDWRPWAVFILATHAGQRSRAILHLKWSDIDFTAGTITWPGEFQKQGKKLERPLTWPVYSALLTARWWRTHESYAGDWVFYARRADSLAQHRPTPYPTIHYALLKAEQRAGVAHEPYRALHGGRRHVVSEVIELTGDRMLGLEYAGDFDTKALRSYDRRVSARIAKAAAVLDAREQTASSTNPAAGVRSETDDDPPPPPACPTQKRKPSLHVPRKSSNRAIFAFLCGTKRNSTVTDGINSNPRDQLKRVSRADLHLTAIAGAGFEPATFGL